MNERLIKAFQALDTNNKKDKISKELVTIGEEIKKIELNLGIDNNTDIYNYNPLEDNKKSEDEYLISLYQDIFNVERELITIDKVIEAIINSAEQAEEQ